MPNRLRESSRVVVLGLGVVWAITLTARADIFHLEGHDTIEAELLEDLGDSLRVRTLLGIVDIEKDRIVKREKRATPWQRYEKKRKKVAQTIEAQIKLAKWCRKRRLNAEAQYHYGVVIQLDPDHAEARRKLGFERKGGKWVRRKSDRQANREDMDARRKEREEKRTVHKLIAQWHVRVQGLYRGRLAKGDGAGAKKGRRGKLARKFEDGREKILAIDDPFALPALTKILSAGNEPSRILLVEVLSQFEQDEATMNLIVLTVLDPSSLIRKLAALELLRRDDPRSVRNLRDALHSSDEDILRNAATALGILKARSAADDLISVLSRVERRRVLVSRPTFLRVIYTTYGCCCRYPHGRRYVIYNPEGIGVMTDGTMVGTRSRFEMRTVSVCRTEVQEALIAMTGQNFGFDREKWRLWFLEQEKKTQRDESKKAGEQKQEK